MEQREITKHRIIKSLEKVIGKGYLDYIDLKEEARPNNDWGLDSLDVVEFMMELEKEFDITIDDEEFLKAFDSSYKDLIDFINTLEK